MHCDACDKFLTPEEATAKFAESGAYVCLCKKCRSFLPKELKIITREASSFDEEDRQYFFEEEIVDEKPYWQEGQEDE